MSNIEHLFENAICAHLRGETYEDFCKYPGNQMMIADEETDPEVIWMLAQYTASTYEVPRWIPVAERLPDKEEFVLVVVNGRWHNIKFVNAAQIAMYDEDGWWIEAYPEWKNPKVSHWMPLPSAPEVE